MVAKINKITNVPLFKKLWDIIFFFWDNNNLRGQKSLGPLKMSLEIAQKVIVPQKNYVPQFLKQRDINSYYEDQTTSYRPPTTWI